MNRFLKAGIITCTIGSLFIGCKKDDNTSTSSGNADEDITPYFTDAGFRAYCLVNFDDNLDEKLQKKEVNTITKLSVGNMGYGSLAGIEYFTALTDLGCSANKLTALDISKNTALTSLTCHDCFITSLDLSKNTALTYLDCYDNKLTALDVSKNTALTTLICGDGNQLATLDVSKNTALTQLDCGYNLLTSLDVSKNTALTKLHCNNNNITSLDVSKNKALTSVWCENNNINPKIIYVWFDNGSPNEPPSNVFFTYDGGITLQYKP
jgi:Leucine-rich repeat (LRR) protein